MAATRVDGEVRVSVMDDGVGIAEGDMPHLFERFYRADQTRSRDSQAPRHGTGLGLSIARWIADEHGGRIDVESQVGHGSLFTVRLPALERSTAESRTPVEV